MQIRPMYDPCSSARPQQGPVRVPLLSRRLYAMVTNSPVAVMTTLALTEDGRVVLEEER